MISAKKSDRSLVVDILTQSFHYNKSVNYIVKQDSRRIWRIQKLMEYSFDLCFLFGDIFLSEDKDGCALILHPEKTRYSLKRITLDLKVACNCFGISGIAKVLRREKLIKKNYPPEAILYLWFIGVDPAKQGTGKGKQLLDDIIAKSEHLHRPIYLETSMKENIPFYKSCGFEVYGELQIPHQLFLIRKKLFL